PGIMEASAKGAGREHTLGVNIELPFEQFSNPYIDAETMLVAMQYFFTRKVAMTRPSNAFAIFPGGLGTMDEAFEVLTLLHTGKTSPAPVVLVDTPDGTFWRQWMHFVEHAIIAGHYIDEHDMRLVRVCTSIDEAATEIDHFFSNYVRFDVRADRGYIKVRHRPTDEQVRSLADVVPRFAQGRGYALEDDTTISFNFDGRNYVNLRLLIDAINEWS
ncbi:MAG TPA: LOG family protein, partial [Acidimicrobiales bacterium]